MSEGMDKAAGMAAEKHRVSIVRRDRTLRLTVSKDVYQRLESLAVLVGVPPATLATVAVGLYVSSQEKTVVLAERMVESIGHQLGGDMGAEMVKQLSLLTKGPQ